MNFLTKKNILFSLLSATLLLSACDRRANRRDVPTDADVEAAQDMAIAEQLFGELKNIADEGESGSLKSYKNGSAAFADCATVTVSQPQKKIMIDFGGTNCICRDMRTRRGTIEITFTGNTYWDSGSVATVKPINYFVNDHQIIGTKEITNRGLNAQNLHSWSIVVNGSIVKPNGAGTIQWTSNRIHTWLEGSLTPLNWLDDEWKIEGTAMLTTSTQDVWNLTIVYPLHRALACRYLDEGVIEFKKQGLANRFVDYGNGTCDDDAVYTVNGTDYPFKLR